MPPTIHPTAIIAQSAVIEDSATINAYAVIKDHCRVGAGTTIMEHVVLEPYVRMGKNNVVWPHAVLGAVPQHLGFKPCESWLDIGDGNTIREFVTLHRGLREGDRTIVGNNCFFMATAHAGHDCVIGDNVTLANGVLLAGHVVVEDRCFVSGHVAVHQFARVGRLAMLGGLSRVRKDVPPFLVIEGDGWVRGLNLVGLRRAGVSAEAMAQLKRAYKIVYESGLNTSQAREQLQGDSSLTTEEARHFIQFILDSKQGICTTRRNTHLDI